MASLHQIVNDRTRSEIVRRYKSVFSISNSNQHRQSHIIPYKPAPIEIDLSNQQISLEYVSWLLRRRNCLLLIIKLTSDLHLKKMNTLIPRKMMARGFHNILFKHRRINLDKQTAYSTLKRLLRAPKDNLQEICIQAGGGLIAKNNFTCEIFRRTNLKKLRVFQDSSCAVLVSQAASRQQWSSICLLKLVSCRLNPESTKLLATNTSWKNLEVLNLKRNRIGDEGLMALSRNKAWISLKRLNLHHNSITDIGIVAFASNTAWKQLEKLCLSLNYISDVGLSRIIRNSAWVNLTEFDISSNPVSSVGVTDLALNSIWTKLKKLNLSSCGISDEGFGVIGRNKVLKKLRFLYIGNNEITPTGKRLLEGIYDTTPSIQIVGMY